MTLVYYIDITDKVEIMNFIKEDDSTTLEIELRDLKSILDDVVIGDYAEFHAEEIAGNSALYPQPGTNGPQLPQSSICPLRR